jgi:hypothetical protein
VVAICKSLKNSINLLRFLGKLHLHKQLAHRHINRIAKECKLAHVATQDGKKESIVSLAEVAGDDALVDIVGLDALEIVSWRLPLFPGRQSKRLSTDVQ